MFARFKQLYAPEQKCRKLKPFQVDVKPITLHDLLSILDSNLQDEFFEDADNCVVIDGINYKFIDWKTIKRIDGCIPIVNISTEIPDYKMPNDMIEFYQKYNGIKLNALPDSEIIVKFLTMDKFETDHGLCIFDYNQVHTNKPYTVELNINDWVLFLKDQPLNEDWDYSGKYFINLNPTSFQYGMVCVHLFIPTPDTVDMYTYIFANTFTEFIELLVKYPVGILFNPKHHCKELSSHICYKCCCYGHRSTKFKKFPFIQYEDQDYDNICVILQYLQIFGNNSIPKYLLMEILEPYSKLTFYELQTIIEN